MGFDDPRSLHPHRMSSKRFNSTELWFGHSIRLPGLSSLPRMLKTISELHLPVLILRVVRETTKYSLTSVLGDVNETC